MTLVRRVMQFATLLSIWLGYRFRCMCIRAFAAYKKSLACAESKRASAAALAVLWKHAEEKIAQLPPELCFPRELDMVFTGGGFKNCYSAGAALALHILHQHRHQGQVKRSAGASAGAQVAFLAFKGDFDLALRWCFAVAKTFTDFPYVRPEPLWTYFYTQEAHSVPLPEPGALRISVSRLVWPSWQQPIPSFSNMVVDSFDSAQCLADALMATASIPFLTCPGLLRWYTPGSTTTTQDRRGGMWVIDGGVTDNSPRFTDGKRPQLVVTYKHLPPHYQKIFYFSRKEMLELIRMGIDDCITMVSETSGAGGCRATLPREATYAGLELVMHEGIGSSGCSTAGKCIA
jgi:hypothetical protein